VVDDFFNWFYSIFTAIPSVLMILAVAAVLQQKGVLTIVLILGLTGWTGPYRLIRAEYSSTRRANTCWQPMPSAPRTGARCSAHLPQRQPCGAGADVDTGGGLHQGGGDPEFLGFGVPVGVVSWGSMLNEAQNELILGRWWQLTAAAVAMALLVTAFSLFTDALRDALDPKVKA
jgi:peptide/nickel transport system permease protein